MPHEDPPGHHLVHGRGVNDAVGDARANQRDVVGVLVQVGNQVGHVETRLAVLAPLAV